MTQGFGCFVLLLGSGWYYGEGAGCRAGASPDFRLWVRKY